jgi:4-amino-4-deoxy-L-arabinose transferase-like glycosyltransferase
LEQATVTKTSRLGAAALLVFLASLATYLPPALVNEAPFWDDKAYINNALIFSGRLSPQDVRGPYAEERPPLFWWLLTDLYALNLPVETARLVSPTVTAVGVTALFLLTSVIFRRILAGLLTALILILSDYFVLTTSYILTDSMGSVLGFLTILCFSLGLRYGPYMWAAGGLMALSILARDQNLLLVPTILLSMVWVARVGRVFEASHAGGPRRHSVRRRHVEAGGLPATRLRPALTPMFLEPTFIPILAVAGIFSATAVYVVAAQKNLVSRRPSLEERSFDILAGAVLCVIMLTPFFYDNVRLGEEFQIAGRGVLSRAVAHAIMVRGDIERMGLSFTERVAGWVYEGLRWLSPLLFVLAAAGALWALRMREELAKPAILWALFSVLYVFLFAHLEARFLSQAVPPLAFLASYAFTPHHRLEKDYGARARGGSHPICSLPACRKPSYTNSGQPHNHHRPQHIAGSSQALGEVADRIRRIPSERPEKPVAEAEHLQPRVSVDTARRPSLHNIPRP